jgi:hypothetical protein
VSRFVPKSGDADNTGDVVVGLLIMPAVADHDRNLRVQRSATLGFPMLPCGKMGRHSPGVIGSGFALEERNLDARALCGGGLVRTKKIRDQWRSSRDGMMLRLSSSDENSQVLTLNTSTTSLLDAQFATGICVLL